MERGSIRHLSCQDAADVGAGEWALSRAGVIVSIVPGRNPSFLLLCFFELDYCIETALIDECQKCVSLYHDLLSVPG